MGLEMIAQTAERIKQSPSAVAEQDRDFVLWFAFVTGDKELTDRLLAELTEPGADRDVVYRKYETLTGASPDWIRRMEKLLVSLEFYRMQEEKAIRTLSEILTGYGVELPAVRTGEPLDRKEALMR